MVSLLDESGIGNVVLDTHMSVLDGSIGVLPRRIMVETDSLMQSRRLLDREGIGYHAG